MTKEFTQDFIYKLYGKYSTDLKKVRECQKKILSKKGKTRFEKYKWFKGLRYFSRKAGLSNSVFMNINPQLDDIESEITYLLIRELKPKNIVEISPCGGWSSTWILNAIKDNGFGKLYSYDIVDDSTKVIPKELSKDRWVFTKGDIKKNLHKLPKEIDYVFMDAEHTDEFAKWYIEKLFPFFGQGTIISVHDVFHMADPNREYMEGEVVINWLKKKNINYFTASKAKEPKTYKRISSVRNRLNFGEDIIKTNANSMIFFRK